jgi:hypothetical protein
MVTGGNLKVSLPGFTTAYSNVSIVDIAIHHIAKQSPFSMSEIFSLLQKITDHRLLSEEYSNALMRHE